MQYAEVIYETGAKSIVSYEDLDELKGGLFEQNRRAMAGEPGAAQDQEVRSDIDYSDPGMIHPDRAKQRPAERVYSIIEYGDTHPADLHSETVATRKLEELVTGMADDSGEVNPHQLISALRDEVSPVYPVDQGRHESIYKAEGKVMDDLSWLEPPSGDTNV